MRDFLASQQVLLKDFEPFAKTLTDALRRDAEAAAAPLHGKVHYLPTPDISKEKVAPTSCPSSTTRAPYPAAAAAFDEFAAAGITTVTGTPSAAPANAYPWAAFPAETVMIPRRRSSGVSRATRAVIPRGLNEPVFWRCSAFR